MVDFQVSGGVDEGSGEVAVPLEVRNPALTVGLESALRQALRDEDFLPGVLAVCVLFGTVPPL